MTPRERWPTVVLVAWLAAVVLCVLPLALGAGSGTQGASLAFLPEASRLAKLSLNSVAIAAGAALVALLLAGPAALGVARAEGRLGGRVLLATALLPLFMPPGVIAVSAVHLFGAQGILTKLLLPNVEVFPVVESLSATASALRPAPIYTRSGAALTLGVSYAPLAFAILVAALRRIDPHAEEAALLDGGVRAALLRIALPAVAPVAAAAATLVAVLAFTEFSVPETLRSLPVLVGEVYVQFGVAYDTQRALLASLVLGVLTFGSVAALRHIARPLIATDAEVTAIPRSIPRRERSALLPLRALAWFTAVAPPLLIAMALVLRMTDGRTRWEVFREAVALAHEELLLSTGLALATGAACAAAALVLGTALRDARHATLWRFALLSTFFLPGPIWGAGLNALLHLPPDRIPVFVDRLLVAATDSHGPLVLAWALRFGSAGALLVEAALRRVPRDWEDAAACEGAGPIERFLSYRHVVALPAAAAAGVLGYLLALGESGAAILLLPPGTPTLSVRLLTLMHFAPQSEVSALSLLALAPGLLALGGGAIAWRFLGAAFRRLLSERPSAGRADR